ncbi:tigger transposable element-derived protein 1-like [Periophthalmus magnuspinnatus]|uniref:tigger transposable element-derived protein 1-like n=1 Tax=Periophthalmus magnuspinnatus TaxID=409849 RepID=UPI00243734AF|nr:tigger transposable element-derived protein 1-like [Periophthalmus magnuspinnatus]
MKRSAPTNAPAPAPKRTRKMLTIAEKVVLLDKLKEGRSYAAVGRLYGINESSVRYIKKEENNIRRTAAITFNKDAKRLATARNKTIVRMESALALWISYCRKNNITLDSNVIRTKAKVLYETFADSAEQDDAEPRPKTSTLNAAQNPFHASVSLHGKAAEAEAYVNNKFKAIIEEGGYKPEQVFNMDETGLFWKRMPSRTFIMQDGAQDPGFKAQKDRVTLVMCGNAAGFMIKPGLIYRSKNPRALKNKNKNALPVYWMHDTKAWMTRVLSLDWFKQCFIPEVKRYLRRKGLDFKVLLLLHNARGHAEDLSYDGVQIELLPPNTTSLIQPLDQGFIRLFKAVYTRNTLQHLVDALGSDQDFSLKVYWSEYTIASCLQNIQKAIQEIKTETLNVCWKKLWPEAVHNPPGSSLDEIYQSAVDTAVNLAKQLGGDGFDDMTPDDMNALIDAHSQSLTDEDLAEMTMPPSEDEGEEEEQGTSIKVEEDGLTLDSLTTLVRMANELERAAQEWDPLMCRSLEFTNIIEGAMSVYKNLLAEKKKTCQPRTVFIGKESPVLVEIDSRAEWTKEEEAQSEEE